MSETSHTTPGTAGAKRLVDMSDADIIKLIERAQTDPFALQEVMHLQKQAFECVGKAVQGMIGTLTELEPESEKLAAGPVSVVKLASAARQREANGKSKRELAESLIIDAMTNRDNPDWNIFDPSTTKSDQPNGILALLKMNPPAAQPA